MIQVKAELIKKQDQPDDTFSVKTQNLPNSLLIKVSTPLSQKKGVEYVKQIKNIDEEGKLGQLFERFSDIVDYLTHLNNSKFNEIKKELSIMIPHPKKRDQTIEFEKIQLKQIDKIICVTNQSTMGIIDRCACKQDLTQQQIKGMLEKLANAVEDTFSKIQNWNKKYERMQESVKQLTVKVEKIENQKNNNNNELAELEETKQIKQKLKTVQKELHQTKQCQVQQIRDFSEKLSAMERDLNVSRLQNNQQRPKTEQITSQEWIDTEGEDYSLLNFSHNIITAKKPALAIGKTSITNKLYLKIRIIVKSAEISIGIIERSNKIYLDSTGLSWDGNKAMNNQVSFNNGTYLTLVVDMDSLSVVWKIHNQIVAQVFCEQLENRQVEWYPFIDLGTVADSIAIIESDYS